MPKTKHTPTPWEAEDQGNLKARQYIAAGEFRIVECITRDQRANAAFIVKAVNNHASMLEALKDCVESLTRLPNVEGAYRATCINQACAVIAEAESE